MESKNIGDLGVYGSDVGMNELRPSDRGAKRRFHQATWVWSKLNQLYNTDLAISWRELDELVVHNGVNRSSRRKRASKSRNSAPLVHL
jgi:hypothetical protein